MTQEERFKIYSNEYVDLIIQYNENLNLLEGFQNETVQIMNAAFAVVYLPLAEITGRVMILYGYTPIPACYGLTSLRSLVESGIQRIRQNPIFNLRGQGVLIGVVDTGIDYTNPIFLHADGTSKIVSIWDQTIDSENQYPAGIFYGTEYTTEQINLALISENPFEVVPSIDELGHGTMMAGIAAGNEDAVNNFSGVVPDSDLVVVKLKQAKQNLREFYEIPQEIPCYQENDIMWGVQYLIGKARQQRRPIAICIGLGSSQGAHNGRGSLTSMLSVGADFPGVTISIAAGNEGNKRRHFFDLIDPSIGYSTVELNVGENEPGFFMELWGTAPSTYSIDILTPTGEVVPRIIESLQVNREVSFIFERTQIIIDYEMVEARTGDQLIFMRFRDPSPGVWRFNVYGRGDLQGSFHIWLPVDGFITEDTYFFQSNPYTTVTSPGNGLVPITVTAYNPENNILFQSAGRGYSRINTVKPELAAPGVNILSPTLEQGFVAVSGTSAAAAHTAGVTAMMLEWGIVRGNYPGIDAIEVKKFLVRGARRSPSLQYPNRDWGYGMLDIYNVFAVLRADVTIR